MTPEELKARVDQGGPLAVLDVREPKELQLAALSLPEPVVHLTVPLGEVMGRLAEIRTSAEGRPLVVMCHHGMRSQAAADWLTGQGMADVHNLDGGIDAWSTRVDRGVPRY